MADDPVVPIQIGDTFVMGSRGHLWIVLSDPTKNGGIFVMANLTSDRLRAGTECELNIGDHPWITHRCYVSFGDIREVNLQQATDIQEYMRVRVIERQFPLKPEILQKIREAGKVSKAIPLDLKRYF